MRGIHSVVDDLRRDVFTEVARLAYEGGDYKRLHVRVLGVNTGFDETPQRALVLHGQTEEHVQRLSERLSSPPRRAGGFAAL